MIQRHAEAMLKASTPLSAEKLTDLSGERGPGNPTQAATLDGQHALAREVRRGDQKRAGSNTTNLRSKHAAMRPKRAPFQALPAGPPWENIPKMDIMAERLLTSATSDFLVSSVGLAQVSTS